MAPADLVARHPPNPPPPAVALRAAHTTVWPEALPFSFRTERTQLSDRRRCRRSLFRTDDRLSYDYQCYGGMDYMEVQAAAGTLENTVIWVPDIELYNNADSIWGENVLGARLAFIYSCWDGVPD